MYATYVNEVDRDSGMPGLYESDERTSDVQLSPAMDALLLAAWLLVCAIGFGVAFLAKHLFVGAVIVAVPTFLGMLIKPTFALCMLLLVLPTGAGVGLGRGVSLDRAVGLAVAVAFLINIVLTRPGLSVRHKALWAAAGFSAWIGAASLFQPYLSMEIMRALTQLQLVVLVLIVYWILETNYETTFVWALRSYVVGMVGTTVLALKTGAAVRAMHETRDTRYAATLGSAIDANMLAALTALAFLSAIYLFARDRGLLWRLFYLAAMLFLPVMMLKIGSRGGLVALAFTLLSPLLFVRQVIRRPALAILLLLGILVASASAGLLIGQRRLDASVTNRLTDVQRAKKAIDVRMAPIKDAVEAVTVRPAGTGYFSWFERTGSQIWPHNDFFFALGVYGVPGAVLFATLVILLMLTVKRMPLTLEKLYARAVLTFLLVMGLSIKQVSAKYFWVFLAFVLAAERLSWWHAETDEGWTDEVDEEHADIGS